VELCLQHRGRVVCGHEVVAVLAPLTELTSAFGHVTRLPCTGAASLPA
jgi:hypothetical protein